MVSFAYDEAPELKVKVEQGELPPVEERLPEEPLVLEPVHEIGKYGGTWNRLTTWNAFYGLRMSLYGFSLIRWTDDGLGKAPNLLTSWVPNEDKTTWDLHFRKGVKWSDGTPFTVDDFLFWWEDMALDEEHSQSVPNWAIVGGETMKTIKLDDYTLRLEFAAPAVLLPDQLATWPDGGTFEMRPAPKHYLSQFHPKYNKEYANYETMEEKQEWWNNPDCPVLTAWMPVELEPGEYLLLERNPYYYAVDPEGNQLPYIDQIRVEVVADKEVMKLKALRGETDMQVRPGFALSDVSMFKQNEDKFNYKLLMYDSGSGTGPCYILNHNNPDPVKADVYREPKFARALSHAINRAKIQKMVYYGQGILTTGTLSPKSPLYHTEKGKEIYEEWRDLALEYSPEKAKQMLDEIGVVDQDGDGWRDLPNGKPLELRIDTLSSKGTNLDVTEMVKTFWDAVGLKTEINPVDNSNFSVMTERGEFDIFQYGISEGRPLLYPNALVPIDTEHFAPLYGTWNRLKGTELEGADLDKAPRDRTPPREEPAKDSYYVKLYDLYKEAMITADDQTREELVYQIFELHLEHGPLFIGTVANVPRIGVVNSSMKNVPSRNELALGGYMDPWIMSYSAILNPPTFFFDEK